MFKAYKAYLEYLRDNPHGYWFKRKLYGWGWAPVKWQGWLVTYLYAIMVVPLGVILRQCTTFLEVILEFILPLIIFTAILITICYKKGEAPKWQWGGEKKKNQ